MFGCSNYERSVDERTDSTLPKWLVVAVCTTLPGVHMTERSYEAMTSFPGPPNIAAVVGAGKGEHVQQRVNAAFRLLCCSC